jgi:pyruvate dehydrogenase E2 component (dihydrolipoamide acetyltransferase)
MSVSVVMPQLGESVTEGTVTRWLKKEGEHVTADEPLLEVSTDKVDTEIPSPASGILRGIAVDEDETVAVGAQLAVIEDSDSAGAQAPAPEAQAPAGEAPAAQAPAAQSAPAYAPPPPAPAPVLAASAPGNGGSAAPSSTWSWSAPPAPAAPAYAPPASPPPAG